MSKEYLVNAYLRRSNKNKQSRTKVACFSNFKMYHDFPVSILNISKTEFVVFRSPRKPIDFDIKIKLNGQRIYQSSYIKYLGVLLDEHLSWKPHIHELRKKLNHSNSMLSKIRHYVNKNTIRSLYFSLFASHISY